MYPMAQKSRNLPQRIGNGRTSSLNRHMRANPVENFLEICTDVNAKITVEPKNTAHLHPPTLFSPCINSGKVEPLFLNDQPGNP